MSQGILLGIVFPPITVCHLAEVPQLLPAKVISIWISLPMRAQHAADQDAEFSDHPSLIPIMKIQGHSLPARSHKGSCYLPITLKLPQRSGNQTKSRFSIRPRLPAHTPSLSYCKSKARECKTRYFKFHSWHTTISPLTFTVTALFAIKPWYEQGSQFWK